MYRLILNNFMPVRDQMINEMALPSFLYKNRSIRWKIIDGELWFIVNDIYKALEINKNSEKLRELQENEKTFIKIFTKAGNKDFKAINEKGLLRIFKNKETFVAWVQNIVAPRLRQTGAYIPPKEDKTLYLLEN